MDFSERLKKVNQEVTSEIERDKAAAQEQFREEQAAQNAVESARKAKHTAFVNFLETKVRPRLEDIQKLHSGLKIDSDLPDKPAVNTVWVSIRFGQYEEIQVLGHYDKPEEISVEIIGRVDDTFPYRNSTRFTDLENLNGAVLKWTESSLVEAYEALAKKSDFLREPDSGVTSYNRRNA